MLQIQAGKTFLWPYEGKWWPVVLCDKNTPPKAFMNSRTSGYVSPAILLGKLIYIWVTDNRLREFDLAKDYVGELPPFQSDEIQEDDSDADKFEKTRRIAFTSHALLDETPQYWKSVIAERSMKRKSDWQGATKRKRSTDSEIDPPNSMRSSSMSGGPTKRAPKMIKESARRLPTPKPTPKQKKRRAEIKDDSDEDDLFVRGRGSPTDPFLSDQVSDEEAEDDEDAGASDRKLKKTRTMNLQTIMDHPPNDDACTIFIDETQTPFSVPKHGETGVGKCEFLTSRLNFDDKLKCYIDLSDVEIGEKDFFPVAEYMQKGEFVPRLIETKIGTALKDVALDEEKYPAAIHVARVYLTASKIQFGSLQLLCVDKLKALYPLSHVTLLTVMTLLSKRERRHECDVEGEVMQWMVDALAEEFWELVDNEGMNLRRLMSHNNDLRQKVLEKLVTDPSVGKIEMDED